ncbi:Os02g0833975, partial [Oryza sativa Japonica Group]
HGVDEVTEEGGLRRGVERDLGARLGVGEQRLVGGEKATAGEQHPIVEVVEGGGGGVEGGAGRPGGVVGWAGAAEGGGEGGVKRGVDALRLDAVLEGGAVCEAKRVTPRQHHQVLGRHPAPVERLLQLVEARRRPR